MLECVPHRGVEPLRAAVEGMEGAENIDRRVDVPNDEHRRLVCRGCGGGVRGRGGKRCGEKQIDHSSPSRGEWRWTIRAGTICQRDWPAIRSFHASDPPARYPAKDVTNWLINV